MKKIIIKTRNFFATHRTGNGTPFHMLTKLSDTFFFRERKIIRPFNETIEEVFNLMRYINKYVYYVFLNRKIRCDFHIFSSIYSRKYE